jgi:hypothetical protein
MSSLASLAGRSALALSVGLVPVMLAACGGTVTVVKGDADCETPQGTFSPGEEFPAGDGCNTCVCESDGNYSCTLIDCGQECNGPVPPCPPPDPGCSMESLCDVDTGSWTCQQSCDDCAGAPPIDCLAPSDCYYTGPYCVVDHYECGDLICDKGCGGDVPDCPPPIDPNCFSYADCYGDGWFCVTECDKPKGSCEEQYPNGVQFVWFLIGNQCGCVMGEVCSGVCEEMCDGGPGGDECEICIQDAALGNEECVLDAAFGDDCQNDFECASYVECVVNGG